MTEDMLESEIKAMSILGNSEEASSLRTKMQMSSLVSDMEAFKVSVEIILSLSLSYLKIRLTFSFDVVCTVGGSREVMVRIVYYPRRL